MYVDRYSVSLNANRQNVLGAGVYVENIDMSRKERVVKMVGSLFDPSNAPRLHAGFLAHESRGAARRRNSRQVVEIKWLRRARAYITPQAGKQRDRWLLRRLLLIATTLLILPLRRPLLLHALATRFIAADH